MENLDYWRKCTTCKKLIGFSQTYWVCSVSTCNRIRTGLVFCDLRCFDAHVPVMNHRDAGAFEKKSPSKQAYLAEKAEETTQKTPSTPNASPSSPQQPKTAAPQNSAPSPDEILVVVSKVKDYIRSQSGMNTSDAVMKVLSRFIRKFADQAIDRAHQNGRKTVLDRDIP